MKPVRTEHSDTVYVGPADTNIGDLHCQRVAPFVVRSVWYLTAVEREAIANGANIALEVFQEPVPPVIVAVTSEQGIGEDAPDVQARLESLQS